MKQENLRRMLKGVAGAAAIALMVAAQPGTAPALNFEQRAGFLDPPVATNANLSLVYSNPTPGLPTWPASTFFDMAWRRTGDPAPDSTLNIQTYQSDATAGDLPLSPSANNVALGDTNNNGIWESSEFWTMTRLTQINNVIGLGDDNAPIWVVDIPAIFTIVDGSVLTAPNSVRMEFFETVNRAPGDCPGVGPLGNPHGTGCDDVYRVLTAGLVDGVSVNLGNGFFLDLTFQLFAPPGSNVILGQDATHTFAYTAEADPGTSILDVQVHWALRPVPTPGSLALLGLGLGALTALRLRRKGTPS